MSKDETLQEMARMREKVLYDEASALGGARREGIEEGRKKEAIEIAFNAIDMDMDIDTIMKLTGLTREEIEALQIGQM